MEVTDIYDRVSRMRATCMVRYLIRMFVLRWEVWWCLCSVYDADMDGGYIQKQKAGYRFPQSTFFEKSLLGMFLTTGRI